MVRNVHSNGPWDAGHPFNEIMETVHDESFPPAEKADSVLRVLKALRQKMGDNLYIGCHAAENTRLAVIIDIAEQVGIKLHIVFTPPKKGEDWYKKEATVEIAPMQTTMGDPPEGWESQEKIPYPYQILAEDIARYTAPDHLAVKYLWNWLDEFHPLPAHYFISGSVTYLPEGDTHTDDDQVRGSNDPTTN